jgi:hypothetical protein
MERRHFKYIVTIVAVNGCLIKNCILAESINELT